MAPTCRASPCISDFIRRHAIREEPGMFRKVLNVLITGGPDVMAY